MRLLPFLLSPPLLASAQLGGLGGAPLMGGFSPILLPSASVSAPAAFAMEGFAKHPGNELGALRYESFEVLSASSQVVAGVNYKLSIEMRGEDGECVNVVDVTVYDRFGDLRLTDVRNKECGAEREVKKVRLPEYK